MMVSYIYVRFFSLRCMRKKKKERNSEELERWEK
jgi:hypothetical protein